MSELQKVLAHGVGLLLCGRPQVHTVQRKSRLTLRIILYPRPVLPSTINNFNNMCSELPLFLFDLNKCKENTENQSLK